MENVPFVIEEPKGKTRGRRNQLAIPALVLGCLAIIPLIGVLLGILGIIFGSISLYQIKKKNELGKGMAITGLSVGVIGILLSITMYRSLYTIGKEFSKGAAFDEAYVTFTKNSMVTIMGHLELYKREMGEYPEDLSFLTDRPFATKQDHFGRPFKYEKTNETYTIYSLGKDGLDNTEDDIYPGNED